MKLKVTTNIDAFFADLDRAFASVADVAVPRALNELRDQAETAGKRKAAEVYKLPVRALDKYTTLKLATAGDLAASITVRGPGFPLALFAPRQTRKGVSVSIKGRRIVIPHTFLATMPNGHTGVFARGAYAGKGARVLRETGRFGRFVFGRGVRVKRPNRWGSSELPISELFTLSPPDAFGNPEVTEAMQDRVEQQAAAVLARNIKFARGGR